MGKIITVLPTQQGVGGKYMTTTLAYGLRLKHQDPRIKIAIVDFNFDNPGLGTLLISRVTSENDTRGIDSLLEKINSQTLNEKMFNDNMIYVDGWFDILRGTKMVESTHLFTRNHVETIINHLRENYDYTLINIVPNANNAGTVFGLAYSDEVVVTTRLNVESYQNLLNTIKLIETYSSSRDGKIKLIYNYRTINYDKDFSGLISELDNFVEVIGDMKYYENTVDNQNIKVGIAGKINKIQNEYNKKVGAIVDKIDTM